MQGTFIGEPLIAGTGLVETLLDFDCAIFRAQQASSLPVGPSSAARFVEQLMPNKKRRTERAASVARRGLNPDVLERAFA